MNPCGEVHDLSLPIGCRGSLACARQHNQWNVISRPLKSSSLLDSYVTDSIDNGFKMSYPLENSCQLTIDYTCGTKIGTPQPIDKFEADSCNFHLKWETRAACPEGMEKVALIDHHFTDPIRSVLFPRKRNHNSWESGKVSQISKLNFGIKLNFLAARK